VGWTLAKNNGSLLLFMTNVTYSYLQDQYTQFLNLRL